MDIYRLGIKIFAAGPEAIRLEDAVPVFHTWIQRQAVPEHLLIDVHDYGHVHQGPGILLVAHEGNFSIDRAEGRTGLMYYRKQPRAGTDEERLLTVLKPALLGCALLEDEPALSGLRFQTREFHLIANDRLHAPNHESTMQAIEPLLSSVFRRILNTSDFMLARLNNDPRERFTVRIHCGRDDGVRAILGRIV